MKEGWKEVEYSCFVKNKDGFDIPVDGVFKCRYGDSVEAVLVSLKDKDGRNVEVTEGEKSRIEGDCAWSQYRSEYGSRRVEFESEKRKVAGKLLKIARELAGAKIYHYIDFSDDIKEIKNVCKESGIAVDYELTADSMKVSFGNGGVLEAYEWRDQFSSDEPEIEYTGVRADGNRDSSSSLDEIVKFVLESK